MNQEEKIDMIQYLSAGSLAISILTSLPLPIFSNKNVEIMRDNHILSEDDRKKIDIILTIIGYRYHLLSL